MLAVVLVYQQIENNLLGPTIYGKAVNISAFFVILGVTLFGALLGVLGALVAVPVTASLQIVAREVTLLAPRGDRRGASVARAAAGRSARPGAGDLEETARAPFPGPSCLSEPAACQAAAALPTERSSNAKMISVIPRASAMKPTQMMRRVALRPQ